MSSLRHYRMLNKVLQRGADVMGCFEGGEIEKSVKKVQIGYHDVINKFLRSFSAILTVVICQVIGVATL